MFSGAGGLRGRPGKQGPACPGGPPRPGAPRPWALPETADGAAWRTQMAPRPGAAASNFSCRRLHSLFFYSMFI